MTSTSPWSHEDIVALERDAWVDLARTTDPQARTSAGFTVAEVGPATAVRCRAGGPLMNRAFDVPARPFWLAALRGHYEEAGVPLYFLQLDAADLEVRDRAARSAGLVRYRRDAIYMSCTAPPLAMPPHSLDVGLAHRDEMVRAAEIFCDAFDLDRTVSPVFASMFGAPRWRFVVARVAGEPVALGILYVDGDRACLFGGATASRFRRRGAQAALVAARVEIAYQLGCRVIGSHTGEPVPGDPQHSYRNMLRSGFSPIGRRETYAPPGIVWTHGRREVIGAR